MGRISALVITAANIAAVVCAQSPLDSALVFDPLTMISWPARRRDRRSRILSSGRRRGPWSPPRSAVPPAAPATWSNGRIPRIAGNSILNASRPVSTRERHAGSALDPMAAAASSSQRGLPVSTESAVGDPPERGAGGSPVRSCRHCCGHYGWLSGFAVADPRPPPAGGTPQEGSPPPKPAAAGSGHPKDF